LDKIASQTNLLALNAAVEAARAKEHGSGFSVVANEVKALARQSAEASTNITALIQATMHDIRNGAESVENTGRALQAIGKSILDVDKISRIIVDQSHGQEADMDSIVSIVTETREVIKADLEMANGISETSENLGVLVQRVNQLLSFFQTNERDAAGQTANVDDNALRLSAQHARKAA
jgi:methyl-accepting chemotaxis protein